MRTPVHIVATWPAWSVRLMQAFAAVEPPPDEAMQLAVATFHASWINRGRGETSSPVTVDSLAPQLHRWDRLREQREEEQAAAYSDADLSVMKAFGVKVH